MMLTNEGRTPDENIRGIGILDRLAKKGDTKAMILLGGIYANGDIVEKDIAAAKKWYQKALDAGDDDAEDVLEMLKSIKREE